MTCLVPNSFLWIVTAGRFTVVAGFPVRTIRRIGSGALTDHPHYVPNNKISHIERKPASHTLDIDKRPSTALCGPPRASLQSDAEEVHGAANNCTPSCQYQVLRLGAERVACCVSEHEKRWPASVSSSASRRATSAEIMLHTL